MSKIEAIHLLVYIVHKSIPFAAWRLLELSDSHSRIPHQPIGRPSQMAFFSPIRLKTDTTRPTQVFGKVVEGYEVVQKIEGVGSGSGSPTGAREGGERAVTGVS